MVRLYSWNINGIRAAQGKGLLDWITRVQPDVLCLQETKAHPDQLEPELCELPGYTSYWAWSTVKKGYSGVAIYTRLEPVRVQIGLGIDVYDAEGRTIQVDFGDFVFIGAYFPNGGQENGRVPFKMVYKAAFLETCERLRAEGRSVIFCGDVNTAHREIDLARPAENRKTTGFLPEECAWIDRVVELGYIDAFRMLHPEQNGCYTYWPYWTNSRQRNVGWRIDYFFTTPDLKARIEGAEIHADVMGSDHCPVSLTLKTFL